MSYGQQNNKQNIYDRLGSAPQLYTNQYGQVVDGYGNAYPDASSAMQARQQMMQRMQIQQQQQAQIQSQLQMASQAVQLYTNQYGQVVDAYGNVYPHAASAMQAQQQMIQMQQQLQMQPQGQMSYQMYGQQQIQSEAPELDVVNTEAKKPEKEPQRIHHKSSRQRNVTGATMHISQKALNTINDTTVSEAVRIKEAEQKNIDKQAAKIEKDIKIEEKNEETLFVPKRPEVTQQIALPKPKRSSWEMSPDDANRRAKLKQSWELRRRRRIRAAIAVLVILLAGAIAAMIAKAMLPYESVNLCDLFTIEYGGYNTHGTAKAVLNDAAVDLLLTNLKDDYDDAFIHLQKPDPEDYAKFRSSLNAELSSTTGLSNGSTISLTVSYDKELAKVLKLDVETVMTSITVNSLQRATVISNDQLFEDVDVTFAGISPNVTVSIANNSQHPFLSSVSYEIVEPKGSYSEGDQIEVLAVFDASKAMEQQYVVDENASCSRMYDVVSSSAYVRDAADISSSIISEAVSAGEKAFTDANEYGVRIYCEANLVPVYVNKKATFEWVEHKAISAYFKAVFDETAGENGNDYNDLDIIYECVMTQADGVKCKCYCAVRFSNFVKNSDGSISCDFSNHSIMSASYLSARVKKNVVDSYVNTHEVTKVL